MKIATALTIVVAGALWSGAAGAQTLDTVTASDPQGLVKLLDLTGHKPELGKDSGGDPKITLDVNDYSVTMWFYGCDEKTHDGCESVQLQSSFDRKDPWPASEAITFAAKWRYGAVILDKDGDPTITWDIYTGEGIPSKVFLAALDGYGDSIQSLADMIFPKDGSQNTSN